MEISQEVKELAEKLAHEWGMTYYEAFHIALLHQQNETINNGIDSICEELETIWKINQRRD